MYAWRLVGVRGALAVCVACSTGNQCHVEPRDNLSVTGIGRYKTLSPS